MFFGGYMSIGSTVEACSACKCDTVHRIVTNDGVAAKWCVPCEVREEHPYGDSAILGGYVGQQLHLDFFGDSNRYRR